MSRSAQVFAANVSEVFGIFLTFQLFPQHFANPEQEDKQAHHQKH